MKKERFESGNQTRLTVIPPRSIVAALGHLPIQEGIDLLFQTIEIPMDLLLMVRTPPDLFYVTNSRTYINNEPKTLQLGRKYPGAAIAENLGTGIRSALDLPESLLRLVTSCIKTQRTITTHQHLENLHLLLKIQGTLGDHLMQL